MSDAAVGRVDRLDWNNGIRKFECLSVHTGPSAEEGATGSLKIAQVAVSGGAVSDIPTRVANPLIAGLKGDGSALLAIAGPHYITAEPGVLWMIPLPAGEPRKLRTIEATDADVFPGGEIVFTRGNEVYVAGKAGSEPRRLINIPSKNVVGIAEPSVSLHGERFSRLAPTIYQVILVPAHLNRACWDWHSPQYIKAMEASFPPDRFPASTVEDPDGAVRFVLKDGTEIHRLRPPDLVYDLDTGEPCCRVDRHGRILPLLPPVTHPEDLPAKNKVEVEILDD